MFSVIFSSQFSTGGKSTFSENIKMCPLQGFCFQFSAQLKLYWLLKKQCAQRNAYTPLTKWIVISWGWGSVREIFHEMYKTY